MSDYETDEPEEATCPYCQSTSWCKHQLMHLDETFGEVEDYGVYEEAQELLVKCVVALLKSGKELPESLGDETLGKFIPLDPDDRPEPTEEAVRDWLADESYYFREYYEGLLSDADTDCCGYYEWGGPGMSSYYKVYYSKAPKRTCAAVVRAVKADLKPFNDAVKGSRSR